MRLLGIERDGSEGGGCGSGERVVVDCRGVEAWWGGGADEEGGKEKDEDREEIEERE